jgi:hypothetical protein
MDGVGVGGDGSGATGGAGEGGSGIEGEDGSGGGVAGTTGSGRRSLGSLQLRGGAEITVAAVDTWIRSAREASSRAPSPPFVAVAVAKAAANATTAAPTTSMICRPTPIAYLTRYPSALSVEIASSNLRASLRTRPAAVL